MTCKKLLQVYKQVLELIEDYKLIYILEQVLYSVIIGYVSKPYLPDYAA